MLCNSPETVAQYIINIIVRIRQIKRNAYALKTPHVVVILIVLLLSRFPRRYSIEIPIATFFDPLTLALTYDLDLQT